MRHRPGAAVGVRDTRYRVTGGAVPLLGAGGGGAPAGRGGRGRGGGTEKAREGPGSSGPGAAAPLGHSLGDLGVEVADPKAVPVL